MIYFLSSIPRSGSTLLASLLGQREDTHVSPTSNLADILGAVVTQFMSNPASVAGKWTKTELHQTLKSIVDSRYVSKPEKNIFDKGRIWPDAKNMETMTEVLGKPPKIVTTVRPMAECIASFYLVDKSDLPVKQWLKESALFSHLMTSYAVLKYGYEKYPENFCIVEYDNLCNNTQRELDRVADFIGIPHVAFSPEIQQVDENDNAWGIKDLHTLEPTIEKTVMDTREILGDEIYECYQGGEFWNDNPEPIRGNQPIDLALEAGLYGHLEKGYDILKQEQNIHPENNRIAFNLGWYEMRRGNLLKGHKLLDRGRQEDVFGNRHIGTDKPVWNGERSVTVFMEMEGGLGDQIHYVRYAKYLKQDYGCKVVIGIDRSLIPIMKNIDGVDFIVTHEASEFVDFDYWLPSMSAPVPLEMEWSDVCGLPYIDRDGESEDKIGVVWLGNPMFEHQQHRLFPKELMWSTVEGFDCISLQKEGDCPKWMEKPSLKTWSDTKKQISRCDLIVTSCTSVAHLAGAIGIETWIIVPILPYYLWALPGDKTPHYGSVTLFRQEKHGCWKAPFKAIKQKLIHRRVQLWNENPMGDTTRSFIEA